jgi:KUP system potassium uptake protein
VSEEHPHHGGIAVLAFGTLGIVFGDIGTSPIYAFRETFHHAELEISITTTYGAASVAFWALVIVISLKYLMLVMRADNRGEGGILALTSLVIPPEGQAVSRVAAAVVTLGVFGTALLYGDGLITPAISVLSAVEGFEVATPAFADWVIPISVAILLALFAVQHDHDRLVHRARCARRQPDPPAPGGAEGGLAHVRSRLLRRPPVEGLHRARLDLPRRHRR